jgi:hypothetical protein
MTPAESTAPAIYVPPVPAAETSGITSDANALLAQATYITINCPEADAEAKELLIHAKKAGNRIEALRKRWTAPLFQQKKLIDDDFKVLAEPVAEAERILRAKLSTYGREQAEASAAALRAAQARAEVEALRQRAENPDIMPAPPVVLVPAAPERVTRTESGTVTMRQVWKFELVAPDELPREYLMPDERAIREAVKDGVRDIPGVRIYSDDVAVVR